MTPINTDLTGIVFGRLTALRMNGYAPNGKNRKTPLWECQCACGNVASVRARCLRQGETKSCGCIHSEMMNERTRTHGMAGTVEYRTWNAMIQRCTNPKQKAFPYYGGRGIKVCEAWAASFEAFYKDMGKRPGPSHSIERNETNGDYCKDNCRWATRVEQSRNKRNNTRITIGGKTQCLVAWSEETGIPKGTISARIHNGMLPALAATRSVNPTGVHFTQ